MESQVHFPSCSHFFFRRGVSRVKIALIALCYLFLAGCFSAWAQTTRIWTNTAGGSWHIAANWKPAGVPASLDSVYVTNNGTYTVYATNAVTIQSGLLGGSNGVQTLALDNGITFTCTLWHVNTNGALVVSNATYSGHIVLHTNGVMRLEGPATKTFTSMWFLNYGGTVLWRGGTVLFNGSIAWMENDGLCQMESDDVWQASASSMLWTNNGTLRKITGTGQSQLYGFDFVNNPSGSVDLQSGSLFVTGGQTNVLAGTFSANAGGMLTLSAAGTFFDAGGVFTGAGTNRFVGTTVILRTNNLPGLKFESGHVALGTNFQQAGAITNLTLDGAILDGTNRVGNGTLTLNGGLFTKLTVQPAGKFVIGSTATKNFTSATLINQGVVDWTSGAIAMGSGVISNGGLWKIESDDQLYNGGGINLMFTNAGTLQKTAGIGDMTRIDGVNFINLSGGLIQVDAGTLRMPQNYTNLNGTVRLNGGTIGESSGGFFGFSPLRLTGGVLDGSGTLDQFVASGGGTISPGNSPGLLQFQSGFNAGAGTTLSIDGTGTIPGTGYDQLSVTGAVAISNCTLQVTSLPAVPFGTAFTIIQNDGADAVQGTFSGLPENSTFSANGQSYRIHYAGGTGNDVTLVSESGAPPTPPTLSSGGYSNGNFHLLGTGTSSLVYTVQASTNFLQWTNIGTTTGDLSGALNFLDTNAANFRYRFYRTTN
jgi:hypothetical protein